MTLWDLYRIRYLDRYHINDRYRYRYRFQSDYGQSNVGEILTLTVTVILLVFHSFIIRYFILNYDSKKTLWGKFDLGFTQNLSHQKVWCGKRHPHQTSTSTSASTQPLASFQRPKSDSNSKKDSVAPGNIITPKLYT